MEDELIREAVGYMERATYSKEQMMSYDKWKIDAMTARGMLSDSERKGHKVGREEGLAEGLEKGEYNKAVAVARKLLAKNMSIDEVSDATDLTPEQIKKILNVEK